MANLDVLLIKVYKKIITKLAFDSDYFEGGTNQYTVCLNKFLHLYFNENEKLTDRTWHPSPTLLSGH